MDLSSLGNLNIIEEENACIVMVNYIFLYLIIRTIKAISISVSSTYG